MKELTELESLIDTPDAFFTRIFHLIHAHIDLSAAGMKIHPEWAVTPDGINARYSEDAGQFNVLNDLRRILISDCYIAMMRLIFPFVSAPVIVSLDLKDRGIGECLTVKSLDPYPFDSDSLSQKPRSKKQLTFGLAKSRDRYHPVSMPDFSKRTAYVGGVSTHAMALDRILAIVEGDFSLDRFKEFFLQLQEHPSIPLISLLLEDPFIYAYTVKGLLALKQSTTPEEYENYTKLFLNLEDEGAFQTKILADVEKESTKPTVVAETETLGGAGSAAGTEARKKNENDLKREKAEFKQRILALAGMMDRQTRSILFSQRRDAPPVVEWNPVADPGLPQKFFPSTPLTLTSGQRFAFKQIMEKTPITMDQALNLLKGLNIPTNSHGGSHITVTPPGPGVFQIVTPHGGGGNKLSHSDINKLNTLMKYLSVPGNIQE